MNITILIAGSLGDVYYFIPFALYLQKMGHTARIVTHINFRSMIEKENILFGAIEIDSKEILKNKKSSILSTSRWRFWTFYRRYTRTFFQPHIMQFTKESIPYCHESDLIIANQIGICIAYHIAEMTKKPLIHVCSFPTAQTTAYPSVLLPFRVAFGKRLNTFTHIIEERVWGHICKKEINRCRTELLHLSKLKKKFSYRWRDGEYVPQFFSLSPRVVPPPKDWDKNVHVYGYWHLSTSVKKKPNTLPRAIQDFIQEGAAPIYIGFGSAGTALKHSALDLARKVIEATGERVVLFTAWSTLAENEARQSERLFLVREVPHELLFPHMRLLIHHGGSSTFGTALYAGKPSVIIPFVHDQFFWGKQAHEIGVAPPMIPHKLLTISRLIGAIKNVLATPSYTARAAELQRQIMKEDGLKQSVVAIEHWMQKNQSRNTAPQAATLLT